MIPSQERKTLHCLSTPAHSASRHLAFLVDTQGGPIWLDLHLEYHSVYRNFQEKYQVGEPYEGKVDMAVVRSKVGEVDMYCDPALSLLSNFLSRQPHLSFEAAGLSGLCQNR